MPPWPRFLSLRDMHNLSVMFLGQELACSVLKSSDRPILIFYNRYRYLYVYVTDNRYSEPIFIYCYKVNK